MWDTTTVDFCVLEDLLASDFAGGILKMVESYDIMDKCERNLISGTQVAFWLEIPWAHKQTNKHSGFIHFLSFSHIEIGNHRSQQPWLSVVISLAPVPKWSCHAFKSSDVEPRSTPCFNPQWIGQPNRMESVTVASPLLPQLLLLWHPVPWWNVACSVGYRCCGSWDSGYVWSAGPKVAYGLWPVVICFTCPLWVMFGIDSSPSPKSMCFYRGGTAIQQLNMCFKRKPTSLICKMWALQKQLIKLATAFKTHNKCPCSIEIVLQALLPSVKLDQLISSEKAKWWVHSSPWYLLFTRMYSVLTWANSIPVFKGLSISFGKLR